MIRKAFDRWEYSGAIWWGWF